MKYIFRSLFFILLSTNNVNADSDSLFNKIISPLTDTVDTMSKPISEALNTIIDTTKKSVGIGNCPKDSIYWDNCTGMKNFQGGLYDGGWRNNLPHGDGKITYPEKNYRSDQVNSYVGEWSLGAKHGVGAEYYIRNGDDFIESDIPLETNDILRYKRTGTFLNDQIVFSQETPVIYFMTNGSSITYFGGTDVVINSKNFSQADDFIYEGSINLESEKLTTQGPGVVTYSDGSFIDSYWAANLPSKYMKIFYGPESLEININNFSRYSDNLSIFTGAVEFLKSNDKFYGTIKFRPQIGHLDSLKPEITGNGTYVFSKTKDYYRGSFLNGSFSGFGSMLYADGSKYVGLWKNSLKSGKGILYINNEEVSGMWKDNRIIERFYVDIVYLEKLHKEPSKILSKAGSATERPTTFTYIIMILFFIIFFTIYATYVKWEIKPNNIDHRPSKDLPSKTSKKNNSSGNKPHKNLVKDLKNVKEKDLDDLDFDL